MGKAAFDTGVGVGVGEGNDTSLQYSCLENPMDGGAWWATVHGITKSQTRLSVHMHTIRMTPHSSTLAWKIPWMEELCRLQSMGSLKVGHD